MLLYVLRAAFLLLMLAVAMVYIAAPTDKLFGSELLGYHREAVLLAIMGLALIVLAVDILIPQKSLMAISGLFFGLIVGLVVTYGLCMVLDLLLDVTTLGPKVDVMVVNVVKLLFGVISCYLAVSFIMQTKDDVRFVIPYVEFSKQIKGTRPMILDTSVIIDGRIADIVETRIVSSLLIVPRCVLDELHAVADSADRLKRVRGRRGIDVLKKLQSSDAVDVQIHESSVGDRMGESVDHRLLSLAKELDGRVVTNDYNLNKIAQVRNVEVININDLANAIKSVVLPGETMTVRVIKAGEEPGQGVGYLDDGTMVVVEQTAGRIDEQVAIVVTSALQTSAGRMIFGRLEDAPAPDRPRRRGRGQA